MRNRLIDIHTHKQYHDETLHIFSWEIGVDDALVPGETFSAGVHPWRAAMVDPDAAVAYLRHAPIAAVGEVGLDYATDVSRERQKEVFRAQLAVAQERWLPVIIHCVKAYNDVLSILRDYALPAVIFHGYIGSPQQTRSIVERGYCVSLGPRSFSSTKTVESMLLMPPERLFLETDDGSEDIQEVYQKAAITFNVPVYRLTEQIESNYKRIFC